MISICNGNGCGKHLQRTDIRYRLHLDLCGPCAEKQLATSNGTTLFRLQGSTLDTYKLTRCPSGSRAFADYTCDLCRSSIHGDKQYTYDYDVCEECFHTNVDSEVRRWTASFACLPVADMSSECDGCRKRLEKCFFPNFVVCPPCSKIPNIMSGMMGAWPCRTLPDAHTFFALSSPGDAECDVCFKRIEEGQPVMVPNYQLCADCVDTPTLLVESHFRGMFRRVAHSPTDRPLKSEMFQTQNKVHLGTGAYGSVCKVQSRFSPVHYAMKSIQLSWDSEGEMHSVLREVWLSLKIKHPNIVEGVEAYFEDQNSINIVMELASSNLLAWVRQDPSRSKPQCVWHILHQLAQGLLYLHSRKIIHRDLKPLNVLVFERPGKSTLFKLGDLGLARPMSSSTQAATNCGTIKYIAPEQFQDMKTTTTASDMWSLGVILYEIMFGIHPIFSSFDTSILQAFSKMQSERIEFPPHADHSLRNMIRNLLRADPSKRLTASEVLDICQCHIASPSVLPSPKPSHATPSQTAINSHSLLL